MNQAQNIENIELTIEQAQECIENMAAFNRLANNKDFQRLIFTNYFEKEASRLVFAKSDDNMQGDTEQRNTLAAISSIGYLHKYFRTINSLGMMAEKAKASDEEERELMMAEEIS